jgi:hypothetical protein
MRTARSRKASPKKGRNPEASLLHRPESEGRPEAGISQMDWREPVNQPGSPEGSGLRGGLGESRGLLDAAGDLQVQGARLGGLAAAGSEGGGRLGGHRHPAEDVGPLPWLFGVGGVPVQKLQISGDVRLGGAWEAAAAGGAGVPVQALEQVRGRVREPRVLTPCGILESSDLDFTGLSGVGAPHVASV